jgi:YhcH/YjgK/YiaL family protein
MRKKERKMIFSSVETDNTYAAYPEVIREVIEYLKRHDFVNMEPGVYEIQGNDIYAQVFDATTGRAEDKKPESHRRYLDIQYLASGQEKIGFAPLDDDCVVDEHIRERDLIFYNKVGNESFITALPGCFTIFFPWDVHRPAVAVEKPMTIRKVVVKVRTTLVNCM